MPCIKNLFAFRKAGCPEKAWDGEEGCPCWIELVSSNKSNPLEKEVKKQCMDKWLFDFQWASVGLAEANAQGQEQLRNGLLMKDENGQMVPKPDMVMYNILKSAFNGNGKRVAHNAAKKISDSKAIDMKEEKDA